MKAEPPNMDLAAEVWQNLPFELVLLILELLVYRNPKRAHQIVLVSRAVQRCIDRFLYEIVTLRTTEAIVSFAWTICQPDCINKSPSFFRDHVKSLCFMAGVDDDKEILPRCPQIHTLSFMYGYPDLESWKHLPLRRLSMAFRPQSRIFDASQLLFPSLTHLELYAVVRWDELQIPECLPLTHLSIFFSANVGLSSSSEAKFPPTLKVILASTQRIDPDCLEGCCQHDIRIVYRFSVQYVAENLDHIIIRNVAGKEYSSDWGRTPIGELNVWEMAEDVVEKRRETLRLKEQT